MVILISLRREAAETTYRPARPLGRKLIIISWKRDWKCAIAIVFSRLAFNVNALKSRQCSPCRLILALRERERERERESSDSLRSPRNESETVDDESRERIPWPRTKNDRQQSASSSCRLIDVSFGIIFLLARLLLFLPGVGEHRVLYVPSMNHH